MLWFPPSFSQRPAAASPVQKPHPGTDCGGDANPAGAVLTEGGVPKKSGGLSGISPQRGQMFLTSALCPGNFERFGTLLSNTSNTVLTFMVSTHGALLHGGQACAHGFAVLPGGWDARRGWTAAGPKSASPISSGPSQRGGESASSHQLAKKFESLA